MHNKHALLVLFFIIGTLVYKNVLEYNSIIVKSIVKYFVFNTSDSLFHRTIRRVFDFDFKFETDKKLRKSLLQLSF